MSSVLRSAFDGLDRGRRSVGLDVAAEVDRLRVVVSRGHYYGWQGFIKLGLVGMLIRAVGMKRSYKTKVSAIQSS